jgi:hypothetical protein
LILPGLFLGRFMTEAFRVLYEEFLFQVFLTATTPPKPKRPKDTSLIAALRRAKEAMDLQDDALGTLDYPEAVYMGGKIPGLLYQKPDCRPGYVKRGNTK